MNNKLLHDIISAILGTIVVGGVLYSIVMLSYSKGKVAGVAEAIPMVLDQGVKYGSVRYNEEISNYQWIVCDNQNKGKEK
jgi:Flp pilus assembly protein protease CpaA